MYYSILKSVSIVIFFSIFIFIGCGDKSKEEPQKENKDETSANYQGMTSEYQKMAEQMSDDLIENKEPVPPVSFKILMNYLPKEVAGLKAEKPRGETVQWEKWTHSNASIDFNSETDNQNARVNIYDYAYISNLYLPYQMLFNMKYNRETSEGYEKSIEINGMPAFERWNEEGKDNEVTVLVGKRFIVHVETNGLDESSARKIAEKIDLNSLAKESSK